MRARHPDRELGPRPRQDTEDACQPRRYRRRATAQLSTATTDLGRRSAGKVAAVVGVLEHRRGMMPSSVPLATYRLQLTPNFGFDQAAELVPYFKALGISYLYSSPFFKSRFVCPIGNDMVDNY